MPSTNERDTVGAEDTNTLLAVLSTRVEAMHSGMTDMRTAIKDLASAVSKLALVEERQIQLGNGQERIFKAIEKLESRVLTLEVAAPASKQTNEWVVRAMWAVAAATAMFAAKKLGLL